jgi:hypothetical protein
MQLPRVLPTVRCDAVHQRGRTVPGADEAAAHAVVQVGYAEWALLGEATGDVDACVADPKADWPATGLTADTALLLRCPAAVRFLPACPGGGGRKTASHGRA